MTNKPQVQIKQFELAEREALLSFLRVAYEDEPRKSDPDYWKWHFCDPPLAAPDRIPLWVVKSGAEVVGQLATIPVEVQVGTSRTRAVWVLDFVVRQDFRRQGLGKRLVRAAGEAYPLMITLGINEQSTAVFQSLQWRALGGVNRYQRLLFPGNALRETARRGPLRQVVNLLYAPLRPRPAAPSGEIRELKAFDAAFDELWERAAPQFKCAVVRSASFLNWQFVAQPGKKFDILALYERGQLAGYVVVFIRKPDLPGGAPPKAAIADLLYTADNSVAVVDELLRAAIQLAVARRVGSLVTDMLDPLVEARLRHCGFWRIKNSPRFMAYTAAQQDLIYQPDNWFLTRGDSDVSIFEQANV